MSTEPHHGVQAPGPGAAGRKPAKRAASPASGTDSYFADLRSLYDELLSHRLADQARTVDAALVALANAQPEDRLEVAMRAFFGLSSTDRRWILMALTDTLPSVLAHRRGQLLALIESRWGDAEIFTPPTPTRSAQ